MLTELSYELKKSLQHGQIEKRYYCEIHIYITGVAKDPIKVADLHRAKKVFNASSDDVSPSFSADELYRMMCNPEVSSKTQMAAMKEKGRKDSELSPRNRLQDIWVWEGRPHWDQVFREVRDQRQHSDIGVCYCGAPVIGADLTEMCHKYSDIKDKVTTMTHPPIHPPSQSNPFVDSSDYLSICLLPFSACLLYTRRTSERRILYNSY
jgi:hypothetical protein